MQDYFAASQSSSDTSDNSGNQAGNVAKYEKANVSLLEVLRSSSTAGMPRKQARVSAGTLLIPNQLNERLDSSYVERGEQFKYRHQPQVLLPCGRGVSALGLHDTNPRLSPNLGPPNPPGASKLVNCALASEASGRGHVLAPSKVARSSSSKGGDDERESSDDSDDGGPVFNLLRPRAVHALRPQTPLTCGAGEAQSAAQRRLLPSVPCTYATAQHDTRQELKPCQPPAEGDSVPPTEAPDSMVASAVIACTQKPQTVGLHRPALAAGKEDCTGAISTRRSAAQPAAALGPGGLSDGAPGTYGDVGPGPEDRRRDAHRHRHGGCDALEVRPSTCSMPPPPQVTHLHDPRKNSNSTSSRAADHGSDEDEEEVPPIFNLFRRGPPASTRAAGAAVMPLGRPVPAPATGAGQAAQTPVAQGSSAAAATANMEPGMARHQGAEAAALVSVSTMKAANELQNAAASFAAMRHAASNSSPQQLSTHQQLLLRNYVVEGVKANASEELLHEDPHRAGFALYSIGPVPSMRPEGEVCISGEGLRVGAPRRTPGLGSGELKDGRAGCCRLCAICGVNQQMSRLHVTQMSRLHACLQG